MEKKKSSILIVDDDVGARESLVHLLMDIYDVAACGNFEEAYASIQSNWYDLAIIDIRLTHIDSFNADGIGILQEILKKSPKTITVVITAYKDSLRKDIFDKIKPDLVVAKGKWFNPKMFKEKVAELLLQRE